MLATHEDLAAISEELGLHALAVEDAVHEHQRPKIDRYQTHLFVTAYAVATEDQCLRCALYAHPSGDGGGVEGVCRVERRLILALCPQLALSCDGEGAGKVALEAAEARRVVEFAGRVGEAQPEKVAAQLGHLFGELCVLEVSKLLGLHRVASL